MVVTGVAVDDVEVLDFVEVVLGGIGGKDAGDTRVEAAAEDGGEAGFAETLTVGPLPGVFEVCLVLRFVVGGVEIAASAGQAGFHDGKVLIGQGEVDDKLGLVVGEEGLQLFHVIGIDLGGLDGHGVAFVVDGLDKCITLCLAATGNHKLTEHISVLHNLERCYCCDATGANH